MEHGLSDSVEITLPKCVCLLLFELLSPSYEQWRTVNPGDARADPLLLSANDHCDRVAFWKLEGAIESTLPELFSNNYSELLAESRRLTGSE